MPLLFPFRQNDRTHTKRSDPRLHERRTGHSQHIEAALAAGLPIRLYLYVLLPNFPATANAATVLWVPFASAPAAATAALGLSKELANDHPITSEATTTCGVR